MLDVRNNENTAHVFTAGVRLVFCSFQMNSAITKITFYYKSAAVKKNNYNLKQLINHLVLNIMCIRCIHTCWCWWRSWNWCRSRCRTWSWIWTRWNWNRIRRSRDWISAWWRSRDWISAWWRSRDWISAWWRSRDWISAWWRSRDWISAWWRSRDWISAWWRSRTRRSWSRYQGFGPGVGGGGCVKE